MNEDFVTFEIAKKLDEKGFRQGFNIFDKRLIYSDKQTIKFISYIGDYESDYFGENISCPTISQVLKWLREEKGLHISIPLHKGEYKYFWAIDSLNRKKKEEDIAYNLFGTYELAALAGIEYVLDNLI